MDADQLGILFCSIPPRLIKGFFSLNWLNWRSISFASQGRHSRPFRIMIGAQQGTQVPAAAVPLPFSTRCRRTAWRSREVVNTTICGKQASSPMRRWLCEGRRLEQSFNRPPHILIRWNKITLFMQLASVGSKVPNLVHLNPISHFL